jgi:hypothetical protein
MLDDILRQHGAANMRMRYAATLVSLEGTMFSDLIQVCRDAVLSPVAGATSSATEIEDEGLLLRADRENWQWLRVRQEGSPDHLFAVIDPTAPDVVWFCCTSRDWLSFIVMLHRPRS